MRTHAWALISLLIVMPAAGGPGGSIASAAVPRVPSAAHASSHTPAASPEAALARIQRQLAVRRRLLVQAQQRERRAKSARGEQPRREKAGWCAHGLSPTRLLESVTAWTAESVHWTSLAIGYRFLISVKYPVPDHPRVKRRFFRPSSRQRAHDFAVGIEGEPGESKVHSAFRHRRQALSFQRAGRGFAEDVPRRSG